MWNTSICLLALVFMTVGQIMTGFIVGGGYASIADWPFIAFVYVYKDRQQTASCGGSLISSQTVLTAAHCLDDNTKTENKKQFGEVNFDILMGHAKLTKAIMRRTVVDHKTHDKYDPDQVLYDIGVMFLSHPVGFHPSVKKAVLMSKEMGQMMGTDGDLVVAGWGRTGVNDRTSEILKEHKQPLIDQKLCYYYINDVEDPGIICGGKVSDDGYAYRGDSGGPLAQKRNQYLAGIVSWRVEFHGITVYSSVPYYYSWIEHTQRELFRKHCSWGKEK